MIIIHFLIDGVILIILFYLIIININASSSIGNNKFAIERVFSSWRKKPITHIKTSNTVKCSNHQMENLISYAWPGTYQGCDCTDIRKTFFFTDYEEYYHYSGNLYSGSCSWNMTNVGCSEIKPLESVSANKWRNYYLCGKFLNEGYFDLEKAKGECSQGFKSCGIIDTLNNNLCVREKIDCPINEFSLKPMDDDNFQMEISMNNNSTGRILTDFQVSDGNLCLHSDHENNFYEKDYTLIKVHVSKNDCQSYTTAENQSKKIYYDESKRYSKVDEYSKKSFYQHNSIYNMINNYLPNYPNLKDVHINLYAGNYIGWKKECLKITNNNLKNSDLNNLERDISIHVSTINSNLNYISLMLILIFITMIIILVCYKYNYGEFFSAFNSAIFSIFYFVSFVFYIMIHNLSESNKKISRKSDERVDIDVIENDYVNRFIEVISNKDCSDDLTNLTLKNFSDGYSSNLEIYAKVSFMSTVLIFFCVILSLMSFYPLLEGFYKSRVRTNFPNENLTEPEKDPLVKNELDKIDFIENDAASPPSVTIQKEKNSNNLPNYDELQN
jgi:hypothetical protein